MPVCVREIPTFMINALVGHTHSYWYHFTRTSRSLPTDRSFDATGDDVVDEFGITVKENK